MLDIAQEQYTGGGVADLITEGGLDDNFARTDSSGTSAMLPDALGSMLGLVNSAGAIATGYQYGPFGQTTATGASSTNPPITPRWKIPSDANLNLSESSRSNQQRNGHQKML